MSYDCLIVGGGLAGLTCGIKSAEAGLRTGIISSGMSALHFSSGSFDMAGYDEQGGVVYRPMEHIAENLLKNERHPYARCGLETIREAMNFFKETLSREELTLYNNGDDNHFHVTTMGTIKPTYFSQQTVFNERIKEAFSRRPKIALLNFRGFRDFYPDLAAANLRRTRLFKPFEIVTGMIDLPVYRRTSRNPHEFRSIDIARIFDSDKYIQRIAHEIRAAAGDALFVGLPAFIGIMRYNRIYQRLSEITGLLLYEIPTLPPSILGMRIDTALKSRFADLGGEFVAGDRVVGGEIIDGRVDHIHTENHGTTRLRSRYYVISTGSFFSGGMRSEFNNIREPIFDLQMNREQERNRWYSPSFFDSRSHPFLEYGVETSNDLHPYDSGGREIGNLFCCGALLAHYNPIREGCGGGVAISTAYRASQIIIAGCGK